MRMPSRDASMIFAIFGWSHSVRIFISLIKHSSAFYLHILAALLTFKNLMATRLFVCRSTASLTLKGYNDEKSLPSIATVP